MTLVLVPLALLFAVALIRRIPVIGGDIRAALVVAGLAAAVIAALTPSSGFGLVDFGAGIVDGVDKLAWVMALSLFGSIYAESQVRFGTMTAVLDLLRRIFGNSPRGLIAAVFLTLAVAGSLLGEAIVAATVIGFLVIRALDELGVKPEQIAMIILVGASLGSLMPPITQAVFLSAGLVGVEPDPVLRIAAVTVGIGIVIAIVTSFRFVRGRAMPTDLVEDRTVGQILRRDWATFVPLAVLATIVILNTGFGIEIFSMTPGVREAMAVLGELPILNGLVNLVVLAIIVATIVTLLVPRIGRQTPGIVATGFANVRGTLAIQLAAGFMVGMFYATGIVDLVSDAAANLSGSAVALGGLVIITGLGMLTGSQTTAQTVVVPFAAPLLTAAGISDVNVALGASHTASGAQNLPPVGLTAFVVCGLVSSNLGKRTDPVKAMVLALPHSLYLMGVGLLFWFLS